MVVTAWAGKKEKDNLAELLTQGETRQVQELAPGVLPARSWVSNQYLLVTHCSGASRESMTPTQLGHCSFDLEMGVPALSQMVVSWHENSLLFSSVSY